MYVQTCKTCQKSATGSGPTEGVMKILVFNAGSSSQKSRLYEITEEPSFTAPQPLWAADADWSHEKGGAKLTITANGQKVTSQLPTGKRTEVIKHMLATLW